MTPRMLLEQAQRLINGNGGVRGLPWARAATLLLRQALEGAITNYWRRKGQTGLANSSWRSQLICLPYFLSDPPLATRIGWIWSALSRAIHHRGLEFAPSEAELAGYVTDVAALIDLIER